LAVESIRSSFTTHSTVMETNLEALRGKGNIIRRRNLEALRPLTIEAEEVGHAWR
jgi:hypothetical protein